MCGLIRVSLKIYGTTVNNQLFDQRKLIDKTLILAWYIVIFKAFKSKYTLTIPSLSNSFFFFFFSFSSLTSLQIDSNVNNKSFEDLDLMSGELFLSIFTIFWHL